MHTALATQQAQLAQRAWVCYHVLSLALALAQPGKASHFHQAHWSQGAYLVTHSAGVCDETNASIQEKKKKREKNRVKLLYLLHSPGRSQPTCMGLSWSSFESSQSNPGSPLLDGRLFSYRNVSIPKTWMNSPPFPGAVNDIKDIITYMTVWTV